MQNWRDAKAIEAWWASPSQAGIKRPYSAELVAKLRDVFPEASQGNLYALRLRSIFEKHSKAKTAVYTISPTEGITLQRMIEAGFDCGYVSGAMTSMLTVTDPGTDQADYTYNSVPHRVNLLNRFQQLQARKAIIDGSKVPAEDLVIPLIADADSGHGMNSHIMKLMKLFVQSGTAGIHIDDLFAGTKRYDRKDNEGYVVVPTCEAIRRVTAAKLQLDIMGSEMVIIYRTDGAASNRLTSTVDYRDRPFILGATVELPADYVTLRTSPERAVWKEEAKIATLDEAFKAAHPDVFDEFTKASAKLNVSAALRVARKLAPGFYWSCDAARNWAGYYFYRGCAEASAARAIAVAHLADMVWSNSVLHDTAASTTFSKLVQAAVPGKWMGHNITGAFPSDGSRDEELAALPDLLAELGFIFQFMPHPATTSVGMSAEKLATVVKERKLLGYLNEISRPAEFESLKGSFEFSTKKLSLLTDTASEAIGEGFY